MTAEVETITAQNARLRAELETERAIVDRVWKALGITTYAGAKGKAIDELVAEATKKFIVEPSTQLAWKVLERRRVPVSLWAMERDAIEEANRLNIKYEAED